MATTPSTQPARLSPVKLLGSNFLLAHRYVETVLTASEAHIPGPLCGSPWKRPTESCAVSSCLQCPWMKGDPILGGELSSLILVIGNICDALKTNDI